VSDRPPFWERKTLAEMTEAEWESLCDGCGRCCLHKLVDIDSGDLLHTRVACRLFDDATSRCSDYANRQQRVSDCLTMTVEGAREYDWLPDTCAYRRLAHGQSLLWWHPLVSGDPETVHQAGISVRGRTISEDEVAFEDMENYRLDD